MIMDVSASSVNRNVLASVLPTALVFTLAFYIVYTGRKWIAVISKRFSIITSVAKRRDSISQAFLESAPAVEKELDFPENWYTSESLYQLEKRAIFSKTWLHVCHSALFKKAGDYRTFQIADFSFVVILGKDQRLRAFQNVCRHRAYTVATKEAGSCLVMRCKYHGWSYDTQGKLIKAPKFENVAGFDRSQNGLYEIRTFIDSSGFLYANFDVYGSDGLTIRVGVPIRAQLSLVESWTSKANFNWKIAIPSGAFRVRSLAIRSKASDTIMSVLGGMKTWRWPEEFRLSPLTQLLRSRTGDLWLTVSIIPQSNKTSSIACSLYCSRLDLRTELPLSAIKSEIDDSIRKLQIIFEASTDEGSIQDTTSQEPLLAEIKAHSRLERLTTTEVHPASRLRETSQACKVADDLCKQLEAAAAAESGGGGGGGGGGRKTLDW